MRIVHIYGMLKFMAHAVAKADQIGLNLGLTNHKFTTNVVGMYFSSTKPVLVMFEVVAITRLCHKLPKFMEF